MVELYRCVMSLVIYHTLSIITNLNNTLQTVFESVPYDPYTDYPRR